jgi:hypothetical protein
VEGDRAEDHEKRSEHKRQDIAKAFGQRIVRACVREVFLLLPLRRTLGLIPSRVFSFLQVFFRQVAVNLPFFFCRPDIVDFYLTYE